MIHVYNLIVSPIVLAARPPPELKPPKLLQLAPRIFRLTKLTLFVSIFFLYILRSAFNLQK